MAPDPKCTAVANALKNSGLTYAELAGKIGSPEDRVIAICAGGSKPTEAEFNALASVLKISNVEHTGVHATT